MFWGAIRTMATRKAAILIIFLLGAIPFYAQISPGDLTKAHAQLEGMLNCTKCHVLGDKVSNEKCLECHKELKSRVDQRKGYHASSQVAGKDCFSCHSEHHGRDFNIVRFDIEHFDHQLTGYKLTGAHLKQTCNACHQDERIESADLRKKDYTYLGLRTDCIACHKDVHRKTLSTDCASCHTTEAFSPASLFDHNKADFALKGKHRELDCKSCHGVTLVEGSLYQKFTDIPFSSCASCHEDPHKGSFGAKCTSCHTEDSFADFAGKGTFNHAQTRFPLVGRHRKIDCSACHQMDANPEKVFQDYKNKDITNCITCHQDVHENKFGTDCRRCHNEDSFRKLVPTASFDHDVTGYPLEGKHETVDCRKCHENKAIDPLPHQRCMDCHQDFHQGQFIRAAYKPDCRDCHSVEGFAGSSYTIEQHNQSNFPLSGAHLATPCFACHFKNETWNFKNIGQQCSDCHADVHAGQLAENYYPGKSCDRCHSAEAWSQVDFPHETTGFALTGKHLLIACKSCHKEEPPSPKTTPIVFKGLQTTCISCHPDEHNRQFEMNGITDCLRCHQPEAWKPSRFDHQTTRFPLDGAHSKVDCQQCHKPQLVNGKKIVQYKLERFQCADCHS